MSRIGDSGPEDADNIEGLKRAYTAWVPGMDAKKLVSILQSSARYSNSQQDTEFGENCVVIEIFREEVNDYRNYVLYRGPFNNVSAIQSKYTKNGVQPLIM